MFRLSLIRLRVAAPRLAKLPTLRRRLQHLRQSNRMAESQLQERRRLHKLLRDTKNNRGKRGGHPFANAGDQSSAEAAAAAQTIRLLPRNDALEAAMALSISENRDARTELELVRRLLNSTLLSLASPVARTWDPYDVKPQVFALNTYIALPVFTSIQYLRLFCERFGFAVRDPSGVLWASAGSANSASEVPIAGLLPDAVVSSEWWSRRHPPQQMHTTEIKTGKDHDTDTPRSSSPSGNAEREESGSFSSFAAESSAVSGEDVKAASPVADSRGNVAAAPQNEETMLDASLLFDAMLMDGAADEANAPSTPHKSTKAKRRRRRVPSRGKNTGKAQARRGRGGTQSVSTRRRGQPRTTGIRQRRRRTSCTSSQATSTPQTPPPLHPNLAQTPHTEGGRDEKEEGEAKAAYWQTVAQTAPFALKQATPLPTFGPFLHPFLLGYFADISTLLHNAAIVPEKVDIVVNPASPIEFVLARAATDRVLHKDQLLHTAYLNVAKELQREFSAFFAACCPEVLSASSACVPMPMSVDAVDEALHASRTTRSARSKKSAAPSNPLQDYRERTRLLREAEYRNGVAYELTILINSTAMEETFMKIQQAKHRSMLMGHADLDILPEAAAAPHVREMAQVFYDGADEQEKRATQLALAAHAKEHAEGTKSTLSDYEVFGEDAASHPAAASTAAAAATNMGVFERRGVPCTINVAQSADSYFHDPTNAYTEAHAVFTEELKVKRGQ